MNELREKKFFFPLSLNCDFILNFYFSFQVVWEKKNKIEIKVKLIKRRKTFKSYLVAVVVVVNIIIIIIMLSI